VNRRYELRSLLLESACRRLPSSVLSDLSGAKIFISGGTGFLGSWVVDLLNHLSSCHGVDLSATVLTRRLPALRVTRPDWFLSRSISFLEGDIRTVGFPSGSYKYVLHGAAETSVDASRRPIDLLDSIVLGGRRVLDFATSASVRRVLFLSSGAVVSPNQHASEPVAEDVSTAPPIGEISSVYANAKRFTEHMYLTYGATLGVDITIARGFAFVGPGMPLDAHFAIGNFIRDALDGIGPQLKSDGRSVRSYLFSVDAAVWQLVMLTSGQSNSIYNMGSDHPIELRVLAETVSRVLAAPSPTIPYAPSKPDFYVPDITRARGELALAPWTSLDDSIRLTAAWERSEVNSIEALRGSRG
jgi:nucleoside-diphosphate-sugar epimerase